MTNVKKQDGADAPQLTKKRVIKKEAIAKFAGHAKDTGSAPVQVSILTEKIKHLTDHLKDHPKDEHSRMGLLHAVGKRRKILKYYKEKAKAEDYQALINSLGIRR